MATKCKNEYCDTPTEDVLLEASGYCFTCAEELACMLEAEGLDPSSAWKGPECEGHPDGAGGSMGETGYCDGSCRQ